MARVTRLIILLLALGTLVSPARAADRAPTSLRSKFSGVVYLRTADGRPTDEGKPWVFNARLVDSAAGLPLPARTVTFTAGESAICTAETDSEGEAHCPWSAESYARANQAGGYKTTFAGDEGFEPSSGRGDTALVLLDGGDADCWVYSTNGYLAACP